jgi:hypothetical protein
VPLRVEACHCGMTRERARQLATAAPAATRSARPPRPGGRAEVLSAMTRDVKVLLGVGALAIVSGLGYLVFGPSRTLSTPPMLGWVDQRPPPAPNPPPRLQPPFKLPWWK